MPPVTSIAHRGGGSSTDCQIRRMERLVRGPKGEITEHSTRPAAVGFWRVVPLERRLWERLMQRCRLGQVPASELLWNREKCGGNEVLNAPREVLTGTPLSYRPGIRGEAQQAGPGPRTGGHGRVGRVLAVACSCPRSIAQNDRPREGK